VGRSLAGAADQVGHREIRESLLEIIRCPVCRAERSFELTVASKDRREIRGGSLDCRECGHSATVEDGIVNLMHDPPDFVVREAAGLRRFAETMRQGGWDRDRILRLPYEDLGYWFAQATAMNQILEQVPFSSGDRILDVGSNTCWASAMFAERGLEVVALDIAPHELQGLETGEWWFDAKDVFFERVLGVMFDPALASGSFDFVFCCEVLHHNSRRNLQRTLSELFRILRPGGQLLVVNETIRSLRQPKLNPAKGVAEYEGNEHAFLRHTYVRAARRAGFEVDLLGPRLHGIFRDEDWVLHAGAPALHGLRLAAANAVRGSERAKKLFLFHKAYVAGGTSLYMIGTKPES
jgi:SAM-dependent methyltransferase/uncharacterized protein YbaR (Trm112 family)